MPPKTSKKTRADDRRKEDGGVWRGGACGVYGGGGADGREVDGAAATERVGRAGMRGTGGTLAAVVALGPGVLERERER